MNSLGSIASQLLKSSPDALVVVDRQGIIAFGNETAHAMFGYEPETLVGASIEILIPERLRAPHGRHVAGYQAAPMNREMGARLVDLFARRRDGTEFSAGIRLAPIRSDGADYVSVAIRDMTERRAISQALIAARQEADRANQAKSRFLATASHDLRQPMQAIRLLNASLLKLTHDSRHLHELLRRQEQAIDSATRLLHALLDISRLESGAIDPHLAPVSLASVFGDLQQEFESTAVTKGVGLEFAYSDVVLSTDRTLFTQLLQNLIGNALKYTSTGAVQVTLARDPEHLTLQVIDSGIGIPADKLGRIFDEYYQVDPVGLPRSGVGLGLAIVREVSRLLGYRVDVDSQFGAGTQVRVRVPAQRIVTMSQRGSAALPSRAETAMPRGRLWLLEDNPAVRAATELFLSLEGYTTRSAATAAEARHSFAEAAPGDVLITDYRLDGKNTGLDFLHRLRADKGWDLPAVLLSGDLESMMRAVKTPIKHCCFLSKPVDTRALLAAIGELASVAPPAVVDPPGSTQASSS